jgi:hypothetical protein
MIKVRAMAEALMAGNLVTQNLMGGNVLEVLLGDLNAQGGTGAIQQLMGPQPGVITIKEVLTGSMNTTEMTQNLNRTWSTSIATSATSPLDAIAANFQANVGNIIVGGVMQTAGWRIFNKVTAKSVRRANSMIRKFGLGSTIQI